MSGSMLFVCIWSLPESTIFSIYNIEDIVFFVLCLVSDVARVSGLSLRFPLKFISTNYYIFKYQNLTLKRDLCLF